jgi:DUF4097 and DUF4098 domain-containing protein YvlB
MKNLKVIVLVVLGLIGYVSNAQENGDFTVPFSDPSKPGSVIVDIKSGSIIVKGTARKDVSVTYTRKNDDHDHDHDDDDDKKSGNSKSGLKRIGGGALDIEASEYQNTIKIKSDNWSGEVDLIVEVPSGVNLKAKAYNDGDVEVSNITGDLELVNYNGSISAIGISGSAIAQTYNGDIKIVYEKLKPDTPLSYANYNGDIDITFPATLKATLKMKTSQGEIYTGFDAAVQKSNAVQKTDSKSGAYKVVIDDWVKADINGGGPEVTMKSYNGDIYVRKK